MPPRVRSARALAAAVLATATALLTTTAGHAAAPGPPPSSAEPRVLDRLQLPNGDTATVYESGVVQLLAKDHRHVSYRAFPGIRAFDAGPGAKLGLVDRTRLITDLLNGPPQPYTRDTVLAVFAPGVSASQDVATAAARTAGGAAPAYTDDAATNRLLGRLGVDRMERLFRTVDRGALAAMRDGARTASGSPVLDLANAYRLHVTGASVPDAAGALLQSKAAVYASPDWRVTTMQSPSIALPQASAARRAVTAAAGSGSTAAVPTNFAVSASGQSLLNTPSTNSVAAFDEVDRYLHQLPGQGEIVTNVSIGDLDDASAATTPGDPCQSLVQGNGPTTTVIGGQRFLDLPSMPLIPTYTADPAGNVNGLGEVCGTDPALGEIGLDFSVMSPLPHDQQRPGEEGAGLTDLLGIAPGASYRLVVPASSAPGISDIDGALLGAGLQTPQPNVITASLGFGVDVFGFPARYLEEDPLTASIVTSLVHSRGIVVSISSNDGTRTFTNAAISPTGGAVATNIGTPTSLDDVASSTTPSRVADSGAIDVGGTTLDDIFAAPPQFASGTAVAQHAYAETRWTGFTSFASGFGGRVNVSAPSDNVVALNHHPGGSFDAVDVVLSGGTSASAPEVAAAAAVVQQVARVTGHPFASPGEVRSFLVATGDAVPQVPQADTTLAVGPQINLARGVERLLRQASITVAPLAPRVGIAQRRGVGLLDGAFQTDTDPANIDLQGPDGTDRNQLAWITIAPDWEGLVDGATFSLTVTGQTTPVLATTRWARLLPAQILAAAGLPLVSTSPRTVPLTYRASSGGSTITSALSLTFGPADAAVQGALAPRVPATVTGAQIAVTYDLTGVAGVSSPTLVVSQPGRVDPATGNIFRPAFTLPLTATSATVQVPVSALPGGGIYGIGIQLNGTPAYSDFAFTRVTPSGTSRPAAPLLSSGGSTPGHFLEIPFGGSFQVRWDVSGVAGATGARIEVSAPGPTIFNNENPFNNPNGTGRDANGSDAGSVSVTSVSGVTGTATLSAAGAGLTPTLNQVVRVVATRSGAQVGEAGDVSTIVRDGVRPADGGFVNQGFGAAAGGATGFITSAQRTASGDVLSSVETFDQTSNAITATAGSLTNQVFATTGWGVWGRDVGLVGTKDLTAANPSTFNVMNPVSSGTLGAAWTPPNAGGPGVCYAATNQVDANGAFLFFDVPNNRWPVYTSNITANTFSPLRDTSAALAGLGFPIAGGFDENTTTRTGVAPFEDVTRGCGNPDTILTTDLASGTSSSFTGVGPGMPFNVAVDSATNRAAVVDFCSPSVVIYDLAARTGTVANLAGAPAVYAAADTQHGLFLLEQFVGGDVPANNNAMSQLVVMDEQGHVVSTQGKLNILGVFLAGGVHNLQVDPGRRIVYGFGPGAQQLQPLGY